MKEKALNCITAQQKILASVFIAHWQDIKDLQGRIGNLSQHSRPSNFFAKTVVHKAFQDLELNVKYPGLESADLENLIDHWQAPPLVKQMVTLS